MMNKIKDFRLTLNRNMALKQIKAKNSSNVAVEDDIFSTVFESMEGLLSPAAVFDTLNRERAEREHSLLWEDIINNVVSSNEGSVKQKDVLAVSLVVLSLGEEISEFLGTLREDAEKKEISERLSSYALNIGSNFITRIIRDEADKEQCAVMSRVDLAVDEYFSKLKEVLDTGKIGVTALDSSAPNPAYIGCFYVPWVKRKRK